MIFWEIDRLLEYVNYLLIKKRLKIKRTIYEFEIDITLGTHLNGNKGSIKSTSHFLKYKYFLKIYVYVCGGLSVCNVCVFACAHACVCSQRGLCSSVTKLGQLWATVWVLGTEPRSTTRAASAANHWTVSSASCSLS